MPFIQWDERYSLNIKQIDKQHQNLFILINELKSAFDEGNEGNEDVVADALNKMADYATYHFGTEEDYMKQLKYPDLESHMEAHAAFTRNVEAMIKKKENQGLHADEMLKFLENWLTTHICKVDQELAPFLKNRGID